MDRRDWILELIDVGGSPGLEFGPLHAPVVTRDQGRIIYVDQVDTATLRRHYGDDPNVGSIVDVDIALCGRPLPEAVALIAPVDYVIASHVIEHVPDPIGWLGDVAGLLRPGGVLSLAVPDKRYCFDVKRRPTELSELVDAHLERRQHPSVAQVYDFYAKAAFSVTTAGLWAGDLEYTALDDDDVGAIRAAQRAYREPGVLEVHCTTFTPASFADLLRRLVAIELLPPFEVAAFHPTEVGSVEFHVSLRRLPRELSPEEVVARQRTSLPELPALEPDRQVLLGPAEMRLIALKRRAMARARRLPGAPALEAWGRRRT